VIQPTSRSLDACIGDDLNVIIRLHEKARLYDYLRKNKSLFAYHIGDLDPFFFSDCTWYGLIEDETVVDVVLVYQGMSTPTVLALGLTSSMPCLIYGILDELPDCFYSHYRKELEPVFLSSYTMTPFGAHLKMDFRGFRSDLTVAEHHDCVQLTPRDEEQLRQLYRIAYPGHYFNPRMLATGKYYGIKHGAAILAVAGVHVYSQAYRIAVIGNVTTHPRMRNRGFAKRCVTTLITVLDPDVDFIGLNVKADNDPAIALYHAIGFTIASSYEEALFEKSST